jgi:hypothetical protein
MYTIVQASGIPRVITIQQQDRKGRWVGKRKRKRVSSKLNENSWESSNGTCFGLMSFPVLFHFPIHLSLLLFKQILAVVFNGSSSSSTCNWRNERSKEKRERLKNEIRHQKLLFCWVVEAFLFLRHTLIAT